MEDYNTQEDAVYSVTPAAHPGIFPAIANMKQVVQNLRTGETTVIETPVPAPAPGSALVRVVASLVSAGTERMLVEFAEKSLVSKARSRPDLARQVIDKARREGLLSTLDSAFNRLDQPMQLGYSSAGTIVALGENLSGFQVGQRVACAGGGYAVHAEFNNVPKNLLAPLPEAVDFEAAAFTTLGAIALHGFRLAAPGLGEHVAIIGLGLLGLLAAGIARAAGCHVLGIDLDPGRVALATKMGASPAVLRSEAESAAISFSRGRGCDVVLICADTPASDPVELAGTIARDRARIVAVGAVGLELPRKVYYEKELSFINSRSYGPGRYDHSYEERGQDYPIGYVRWTEGRNMEAFVDLLASGRLDVKPLITHRFPIEAAPKAYKLITGKQKEPFLGVLLTYPAQPDDEKPSVGRDHVLAVPASGDIATQPSVRLGVLGAGNFASAVLLPVIRDLPHLELVGIASARGLTAQHTASRYGFRYATAQESEILNDGQVNTIAILTRHDLHARQILAGLRAGKNVFCEKPLAIRVDELDEIFALLSTPDVHSSSATSRQLPLLTVGFNRRFAPLATKMKAFMDGRSEPLVAQYRVNAGYLPPDHWLHDPKVGGGRIIGEGCHFVDFLTFLVGEPPQEVSAVALPDIGRYREDNIVLTLRFGDGSIGVVQYLANGDRSLPKERVEVFSSGRAAILEDFRALELFREGHRDSVRSRLRQDKGHRSEWEAFIRSILEGEPPPIPYAELYGVTRACFAVVEALRTGEKVRIL